MLEVLLIDRRLRFYDKQATNLDVTTESISAVWTRMDPRPVRNVIYHSEPTRPMTWLGKFTTRLHREKKYCLVPNRVSGGSEMNRHHINLFLGKGLFLFSDSHDDHLFSLCIAVKLLY